MRRDPFISQPPELDASIEPRPRSTRDGGAARAALVLAAFGAVAAPRTAAADIAADADRIARAWEGPGVVVERRAPLFLEQGRVRIVVVDPTPAATAPSGTKRAATDARGCTTLALVAPRSTDLVASLDLGGAEASALAAHRAGKPALAPSRSASGQLESDAGAAMIVRCGAEREDLRRVRVELVSGRSAIELVVARSPAPLTDLRQVLPERAAGPVAARGHAGRPLHPGPLEPRVLRARERAIADGAADFHRVEMRASARGGGEFGLRMPAGCHRVELMADVPGPGDRGPVDVDAEARDVQESRLLARDRAESPDARLDFCLGRTTAVELPFMGAAGGGRVVAAGAFWPIAAGVPEAWGHRARAGFASAILRRRAPVPRTPPIFEALGVQGSTDVPVSLEPGRCYLAAVAVTRGEPHALRLTARLGERSPRDEVREGGGDGAAVALCAETESDALLTVDARGINPWWALALWPLD